MDTKWVLDHIFQIIGAVFAGLIAFLIWSIQRHISELGRRMESIEKQIPDLVRSTATLEARIPSDLASRLTKIEDRLPEGLKESLVDIRNHLAPEDLETTIALLKDRVPDDLKLQLANIQKSIAELTGYIVEQKAKATGAGD